MITRVLLALAVLPLSIATAQSQAELHRRADRSARHADSTLNAVYHQLETRYQSDSTALRKLRVAQRAWIRFRDAQIDATYPASDHQRAYGSVYPMCAVMLFEELTKERIAQIRAALHPTEGDVCAGGPS